MRAGTNPVAVTSTRHSLGFRSISRGVVNEPSGPVRISGLPSNRACFHEAREVVSGNPNLHFDGKPAQRGTPRPEHPTGHGKNRDRRDGNRHHVRVTGSHVNGAFVSPIPQPRGDGDIRARGRALREQIVRCRRFWF